MTFFHVPCGHHAKGANNDFVNAHCAFQKMHRLGRNLTRGMLNPAPSPTVDYPSFTLAPATFHGSLRLTPRLRKVAGQKPLLPL